MIDKLLLFTDGSVNNQLKVGCGAYLVLSENDQSVSEYKEKVNTRVFENTSSTKLELQTLLWALEELLSKKVKKVVVYTDSQNIVGLPNRRISLEQTEFRSGKGKLLTNHKLYREFFKTIDLVDCEFIKLKGHQPNKKKDNNDHLFTLVDRAARKALKKVNN